MSESWQGNFIDGILKEIYRPCRHNRRGMCQNDLCDQYGEFVAAQFCREICPHYEQAVETSVEED